MPKTDDVHAASWEVADTTVVAAADRLVVFQKGHHETRQRGAIFDPASDSWTAISSWGAPRFGSFDEGPGPLGGEQYFAFEDWVVILWFDGNHHQTMSGAVFDARHNRWREMNMEGGPKMNDRALEAGTNGVYVRVNLDPGGEAWRYDVRDDRWAKLPPRGDAHTGAIAAAAGKVVVWGAFRGEEHGQGQVLDLSTNAWKAISVEDAPSGRGLEFWSAQDGKLIVWSGAGGADGTPTLSDGAIYELATDRWTPIPGPGAPEPAMNARGGFPRWTGRALMISEADGFDMGGTRRLTFWDPERREWWRSKVPVVGLPLVLGFGRVLVLDPEPTVIDVHARSICPISRPAAAIFEKPVTNFIAVQRVGDEEVVWGRLEALEPPRHCPPGAPCMPSNPATIGVDEGAVLRLGPRR